jgi:transcriptional regulator with XRE-family HTH domain
MAEPSNAIGLQRRLAAELRNLRVAAGLSRPQVAEHLKKARSAVGHWETGETLPRYETLAAVLRLYGVPERLEFLHQLTEAVRDGRNWWTELGLDAPAWFDYQLGLETAAAEVISWDSYLLGGLYQTARYAESVIRADQSLTDAEVADRVRLRMARRQVMLDRPEPAHLVAVIDELVLLRRRGTAADMADQLRHLLTLADRTNITIQIMRAGTAHDGQHGSFRLLRFPTEMAAPDAVSYETFLGGETVEDPRRVELWASAVTQLRAQAATPDESTVIIQDCLNKWEGETE